MVFWPNCIGENKLLWYLRVTVFWAELINPALALNTVTGVCPNSCIGLPKNESVFSVPEPENKIPLGCWDILTVIGIVYFFI